MTRRTAVATYLGFDAAEMGEYRYHAGRTSAPIWAIDQSYFTAGTDADASEVAAYLGMVATRVFVAAPGMAVYRFNG